jgi:hypothetical protein
MPEVLIWDEKILMTETFFADSDIRTDLLGGAR